MNEHCNHCEAARKCKLQIIFSDIVKTTVNVYKYVLINCFLNKSAIYNGRFFIIWIDRNKIGETVH